MFAVALAGGWGVAASAEDLRPNAAPAESDHTLAWREAVAEPNGAGRVAALDGLAPAVAEADPRAALLLAETLDGLERDILIGAAWTAWGRQDAQAALAGLKELPELGASRGCIVNGWPVYKVLEGWTQTDPRAAFAWTAADSGTAAWAHLPLRAIAESNVADALSLAEQLEGTARQQAIRTVLGVWAQDDPRAAAAWVADASPEDAAAAFMAVAGAWAGAFPDQALDWADTLPEDRQLAATRAVFLGAARASPDAASVLVGRVGDPQRRLEASQMVVAQWVDSAPADARRWIAGAADGAAQRDLYVTLFRSWARSDREGAAKELREIANTRHRDAAALAMLHQTISNNFRHAALRVRSGSQTEAALHDHIDFADGLYGRIRDAEIRRNAAWALYDTLHEVAPERAERYREIAGVTDESNQPE